MSILFVFNFNVQFDSLWSKGGNLTHCDPKVASFQAKKNIRILPIKLNLKTSALKFKMYMFSATKKLFKAKFLDLCGL